MGCVCVVRVLVVYVWLRYGLFICGYVMGRVCVDTVWAVNVWVM
jgi:hypothetical protein